MSAQLHWLSLSIGLGIGLIGMVIIYVCWRVCPDAWSTTIHEDIKVLARKTKPQMPHEQWPEVLHWQEGDYFDFIGAFGDGIPPGWSGAVLVQVNTNGTATCKDQYDDNKAQIPLSDMLGFNQSLRNRDINESLKTTSDYMELLDAFNKSVAEIQERDRRNGIVDLANIDLTASITTSGETNASSL